MKNKFLTLFGTSLLASLVVSPAVASNKKSVIDFARVTYVEPIYRYVTVHEPQRQCEYVRPIRQRHHNNRRYIHDNYSNGQRRFISGESIAYKNTTSKNRSDTNTGSAAVIGGVIGGGIGHQLSSSLNSRSDHAITLTGAAIGSVLAQNAARHSESRSIRQTTRVNYTNQINSVESLRRQQSNHINSVESLRRHNRNTRRNSNRRAGNHQNRLVERCVTTTVSRQERRHEGYYVTYVYRGNTFQTRTDQHPGDRIRVRVQVRPH